jgi:molybdate transport system substrate-binding protein
VSLRRRAFLAAAALLPRTVRAQTPALLVFAAASLADALAEIARAFESARGTRVDLALGGSNDLARQIRAGAPADVFVSADRARVDELLAAGLVRAADRLDLLSNRLAVVVPARSSATVAAAADLARFDRIALAQPEAVPAGVYARGWLERAGVWETVRGRVVPTVDVRAAATAVTSGAADAGVVYRTDARAFPGLRVAYEVPAAAAPRIVYPACRLAGSRHPLAPAFLDALRAPAARAVFERHGFEVLARA